MRVTDLGQFGGNDNDYCDTLVDLGLTNQQARVYIATAHLGYATIKDLTKAANINRGDCYRVTNELQDRGLIEKTLDSPITFSVTSFKQGIHTLIKSRKERNGLIEQKALRLIKAVPPPNHNKRQLDKHIMFFSPKTANIIEFINNRILDAQESLDVITMTGRVEVGAKYPLLASTKKALKKGILMRYLLDGRSDIPEHVRVFLAFPCFTCRIASELPTAPLAILDKKHVYIFISENVEFLKASALITDNKRLVGLCQRYFDQLWATSSKPE